MSNGGAETYRILYLGFHEKFDETPTGYQLDVLKLGRPEAKAEILNIVYNIFGSNGTHANLKTTDAGFQIISCCQAQHDFVVDFLESRK